MNKSFWEKQIRFNHIELEISLSNNDGILWIDWSWKYQLVYGDTEVEQLSWSVRVLRSIPDEDIKLKKLTSYPIIWYQKVTIRGTGRNVRKTQSLLG